MKRLIVLLLSILVLATMLTGCGFIHFGDGSYDFSVGGKDYDVDDKAENAMDGVDRIEISSVSDDVTILGGGSMIASELKGQCRSTTKPVWLETHMSGSTLHIEVKYPKTINYNDTMLTVIIPGEYAGALKVYTVSGQLEAVDMPFKLQQVNLGTVSGGIRFSTASCSELKLNSVSGDIDVAGVACKTKADTISGNIDISYAAFAETSVSTVSGSVTAAIPQTAAFRVDFNSLSGSFRSSHSGLSIDNARHGFTTTVSDGTETIKVNTTSGDFRIEGK